MPDDDPAARFDAVDWSAESGGPRVGRFALAFLAGLAVLGAALGYDLLVVPPGDPTVPGWDVSGLDWLFLSTTLALACFGVGPLAARPRLAAFYLRRLRRDPAATASLAYVVGFFVVGAAGPALLGRPELDIPHAYQPPVGFAIDADYVNNCVGPVAGERCHGTWRHPLGTTDGGKDVLVYAVHGARVALDVALLSSAILVPLGTAVGTTAAYYGGRTDEVLMRAVDLLQAVPAFLVYVVVYFLLEPGLFLLVVVFGATSWGGVARLVRAEALSVREAQYVTAAESAGGRPSHVVRRHLLPNVSGTVLAAAAMQIPTLVLAEAALSYLDIGAPLALSWGQLAEGGLRELPTFWWISTVPAVALSVTALSFNVLADGLRDVLDPRTQT